MTIYTIRNKADNQLAWDGFKQRKADINEVMKMLVAEHPEFGNQLYIDHETV